MAKEEEGMTELNTALEVFEQSAIKLPNTAVEVHAFVRDALIAKTKEIASEIDDLNRKSLTISVKDETSAAMAREIILHKKELADKVDAALGLIKKKAHSLHKGVKAAEELLLSPLDSIEEREKSKIGDWVKAEQARQRKEYLEEQERQQKEKDRKIKAAQKKADDLLAGITDLNKQAETLEAALNNPEITQEESDALSSKISALRAQLTSKQVQLDSKTTEIHDLSKTVPPPVQIQTKLAGTGIKPIWKVTVQNPMTLLNAVVSGLVAISVVEFSASQLKKLANGGGVPSLSTPERPVIPGCVLEEDIQISTRR